MPGCQPGAPLVRLAGHAPQQHACAKECGIFGPAGVVAAQLGSAAVPVGSLQRAGKV